MTKEDMIVEKKKRTVFTTLGIVGWDKEEVIIMSALLSNKAICLVGKHGTGKTAISGLISRCLLGKDTNFRPFNAPTTGQDELMGYINVDEMKKGKVEFIETPSSVWGADAILIDELNRAHPGMQAKFMELALGGTINGMETGIKFKWSAINGEGYKVTPLDLALASRFSFIEVPIVSASELLSSSGFTERDLSKKFKRMQGIKVAQDVKDVFKQIIILAHKKMEEAKTYVSGRQINDMRDMLHGYAQFCKVANKEYNAKDIISILKSLIPSNAITGVKESRESIEYIIKEIDTILTKFEGIDFEDPGVVDTLLSLEGEHLAEMWHKVPANIQLEILLIKMDKDMKVSAIMNSTVKDILKY